MSDRPTGDAVATDGRPGPRATDDTGASVRTGRTGRRRFLRRAGTGAGLALAGLAGCFGATAGRVYLSVATGAFHDADERYLRDGLPDGAARHAAALLTGEGEPLTAAAPRRLRDRVAATTYGRQCLLVAEARTTRRDARRLVVPTGGVRTAGGELDATLEAAHPTGTPTATGDTAEVVYTGVYVLDLEGAPRPEHAAVTFPGGGSVAVRADGG